MPIEPEGGIRYPEIRGDVWLNGEPVSSQGIGTVLFFWDYCSNPSLRALPFVKEWHRRYAPMGLSIIGIHSPRYEFGKNFESVLKAVRQCEIEFPVTTDNTKKMADSYRLSALPLVIILTRNGKLCHRCENIRGYLETERAIQSLLYQSGLHGLMPDLFDYPFPDHLYRVKDPAQSVIQMGYRSGFLGNVEGYSPELPSVYSEEKYFLSGRFYLNGVWIAGTDHVEYAGEEEKGNLITVYEAKKICGVFGDSPSFFSLVNEGPLDKEQIGSHKIELEITSAGLLDLIANETGGYYRFTIVPRTKGLKIYSLEFIAEEKD